MQVVRQLKFKVSVFTTLFCTFKKSILMGLYFKTLWKLKSSAITECHSYCRNCALLTLFCFKTVLICEC